MLNLKHAPFIPLLLLLALMPANAAPSISAVATLPTMTFVDPHTGKLLWKAQAHTLTAETGKAASSVIGTMHGVTGVLYQNGAAADHITADTVTADQANKTMTATGGVFVQSIADRSTTIRCDRVTWHANTNLMLGSGHVVFKKGGFTQTGPSFQADTKMRTLIMPAPQDHGKKIKATLTKL